MFSCLTVYKTPSDAAGFGRKTVFFTGGFFGSKVVDKCRCKVAAYGSTTVRSSKQK
jgi:hypothetical protein